MENGAKKEQTVTVDENNKATVRIGNRESVDVKATAEDVLAQVSVNRGLSEVKESTKTVPSTEESTNVPIQILLKMVLLEIMK